MSELGEIGFPIACGFPVIDAAGMTEVDQLVVYSYEVSLPQIMENAGRIGSIPCLEGIDPHGMMLKTVYTKETIGGFTSDLMVKNNYGTEGVTTEAVLIGPTARLGAVTIMFHREAGVDPEDQDWSCAKFLLDGSFDKNLMRMALARKIAKAIDEGCIAGQSAADGDETVFSTTTFCSDESPAGKDGVVV